MTTEYYVPEWMLKRTAKQLSRQIDITHVGALNELALELGFQDWAHLQREGSYFPSDEDSKVWISSATKKIVSFVECQ